MTNGIGELNHQVANLDLWFNVASSGAKKYTGFHTEVQKSPFMMGATIPDLGQAKRQYLAS
jgi:hypothetical protein